MTPNLNELDAFAAVARLRSFRKAAEERGVSASALSHALRGLEERLGVRLLHRTTRSVTPTESGQLLLARLAPALQDVAEALGELAAMQAEPTGMLRLNVPRPAARIVLGPLLARFAAAHPRVLIEVVTDDRLSDIVGEGFDAGIRFGESLAGDMVAVPLGPLQRFVMVASPAYLAAHGTPQAPRDLLAHACIGRRFPSGHLYAWELQAHGEPLSLVVQGPLVFDDDMLMIQAACDAAGIAYVYASLVQEQLQSGQLVTLLDGWCAAPSRFYLYYSSRKNLPSALKAFVELTR